MHRTSYIIMFQLLGTYQGCYLASVCRALRLLFFLLHLDASHLLITYSSSHKNLFSARRLIYKRCNNRQLTRLRLSKTPRDCILYRNSYKNPTLNPLASDHCTVQHKAKWKKITVLHIHRPRVLRYILIRIVATDGKVYCVSWQSTPLWTGLNGSVAAMSSDTKPASDKIWLGLNSNEYL